MVQSHYINLEVPTVSQKANTAVICLSPYQGGMELDTLHLSRMLSKVCDVTLIAREGHFIAKTFSTQRDNERVTMQTIDFNRSFSISIITHVHRIIKEKEIINVLFLGASELKSLYFSFLGLDINLIIRHGTTKSSPKKDWFHRLIYSNVATHVAICQHLAKNVKKIIPFGPNTKLKVIYPSLNISFPPPQKRDFHTPLKLLHVGRIAPAKGQLEAIQACSILYENGIDFTLHCVGSFDKDYEKSFRSFLDQQPYKEKIKLIGHTDHISTYYEESDIFLFPSAGEGLSNAFIEALSAGLLCISFDNTSFPELQKLGFQTIAVTDQNMDLLQKDLLQAAQSRVFTYAESNHLLTKKLFSLQHELDAFSKLLR